MLHMPLILLYMVTSQVKLLPYSLVIISLSSASCAVFGQLPLLRWPALTTDCTRYCLDLSPNYSARILWCAILDSFETILVCDFECCWTNGFTEHIPPPRRLLLCAHWEESNELHRFLFFEPDLRSHIKVHHLWEMCPSICWSSNTIIFLLTPELINWIPHLSSHWLLYAFLQGNVIKYEFPHDIAIALSKYFDRC
jgi:hypothetical protein